MSTSKIKNMLANSYLDLMPPLFQRTLLEDESIRNEYNIETDAILTISNSDISFHRSDLFESIRNVLSGSPIEQVLDLTGRIWDVSVKNNEGQLPKPFLTSDLQEIFLPDLVVFSPNQSTRLKYLEMEATNINISKENIEIWQNILGDHALTDNEIDSFQKSLNETPIKRMQLLHNEIVRGHINFSTMVPPSKNYFEQLIGVLNTSETIVDFTRNNLKTHLDKLLKWDKYNGFLYSLILSSHSSISNEIKIDALSDEEITNAFDFIIKSGDRISQIGAIEVGLRELPSRPYIEQHLLDLIKQIRDDIPTDATSGFKLLSSLFVFIYGELSHLRLFSTYPPFYRRLSALSQAALIQRELTHSPINNDFLCEEIFNGRAEQFLMQSYADMRIEPRWSPDYVSAQQIKADFIGRIIFAGQKYERNIVDTELHKLIFGNEKDNLFSQSTYLNLFLPGPLEGKFDTTYTLPENITEIVKEQLNKKNPEPSSFIGFVNSALIFGIDSELIDLVTNLIKTGKYQFTNVKNKEQLLSILNGLSIVAAISKNKNFADDILILIRKYQYDPQFGITPVEAMRICLIASASRSEINEWVEYVGKWLTDLSFSDFPENEGAIFYSHLQCLLQAIPELWGTCGRADAALIAYNNRMQWKPISF